MEWKLRLELNVGILIVITPMTTYALFPTLCSFLQMAECWTTLRELLWTKPMFNLINPSKVGGMAYRNSGMHIGVNDQVDTSRNPTRY